jgi:signal transduction histidine kinase
MIQKPSSRQVDTWLFRAIYAYVAILAVVTFLSADNPVQRWLGLGLMLAFAAALSRTPRSDAPEWQAHLYLGVQTLIVVGLIILLWPNFFLFYILSVQAMILLPPRRGLIWMVGFIVVAIGPIVYEEGWPDGVFDALLIGFGFFFIGAFAYTRMWAEEARYESQQLLKELQVAHRQLQEHAERAEALAVAEERNRLSRDLHDTLGHRLTVAVVQLEGAERLIPGDPNRAAHMVATVREQIREGLGELRRTVATLRTPLAEDISLLTALKQLAGDFERATQLQIHTSMPDTLPPLPDSQRIALYRAAQEALTNIGRHARARTACLALEISDEAATLTVSDDGVGPPEGIEGDGFGLRGMHERAAQLGGEVGLTARTEGGTKLVFRLPLRPDYARAGESHND